MPQIEAGKTIEEFYWERIREMSPAEKIRKAARMTAGVRAMVEHQIREKEPDIDNNALKFAVARRCYWDEPKTLAMLDEAEEKMKRRAADD
jgi:hypothetical protein